MSTVTIPVFDTPRQTFQVRLSNILYRLRLQYNDRTDRWSMSIYDGEDNPIIAGMALVINFPLFFGARDPRLPPGQIFVIDPSGRQTLEPDRTAWSESGQDLRLVYIEDENS